MYIYILILIIISYLIWENVVFPKIILKYCKKYNFIISILYYFIITFVPCIFILYTNKWNFEDIELKKICMISLMLFITGVSMHIKCILYNIVNNMFICLCVCSIIEYYILGMKENLNAWILLLVISVIYKLVKCVQRRKNNKINNKE